MSIYPSSIHQVPTRQGHLHVEDHPGSGDPFVLMHGFPDNRHIYDELVPHLVAAGRRVVTFDFLGFGDSARPTGASYGFAQQLDDLKAVVDGLALGRLLPVGHDASGAAALNFALSEPDKVSSVCLLNSLYAAGPSTRVPELIRLFATDTLHALSAAALNSPEVLDWLFQFQQRMFCNGLPEKLRAHFMETVPVIITDNWARGRSTEAFAAMTADLIPEVGRNMPRLASLASLRVPVALVWGEHDPYLGSGVATELLPHLPAASLTVLPAGHWLQLDMPREVASAMLATR